MSTQRDRRRTRRREAARRLHDQRDAHAPSKKFILYQRPRSPSISPWSAVTITTVSSASRTRRAPSRAARPGRRRSEIAP